MMTNKNDCFSFDKPRAQYFSLPSNVIYRLWKFPKSSAVALKLYQTCKYFYYKQNAAFVDDIIYSNGYRKEFGHSKLKLNFKENVLLFSLRNTLRISSSLPPFLDRSSKMLRYSNITFLSLRYLNLKYNEFEILTSITTIKSFTLRDSEICYSDDSPVTIDVVLTRLPNIENFYYENYKDDHPLKALANLNKLKLSNKLQSFHVSFIHELHDTFNPTLLCKFITNNIHWHGAVHVETFFKDAIKGKILVQELKRMRENWENLWPSFGISGPYCTL